MRLVIPGTLRARLAGAALAAVVALIAIAGVWHEHALLLEGFHLCAPSAAAPKGQDRDCLACKIVPPFSTPWTAPTLLDPGRDGGQALPPHEAHSQATSRIEPAAPRGPPSLPQA